jgi:two-component system OmpR family response regulator
MGKEGLVHLLLVGGHKPLIKALKQGLEEELVTVDVVYATREEAWCTSVSDYDAVVLDLVRPEAVGLAFIKRCHIAGRMPPVLVLTPHRLNDIDVHLPQKADWLIKPFDLDEFFDRVHMAACRNSLRQPGKLACHSRPLAGFH